MESIVKRDSRIDFLRAVATLLVLNSHMGVCYGSYSSLATGGAIGDALFFFASGFTLYLGRRSSFDNWYKRRIMRIFPAVFVVGIVAGLVFQSSASFLDVILCKQYWFIPTIMLCYIPLFFIRRYFRDKALFITAIGYLILFFLFFFLFYNDCLLFYGSDSLWRKFFYFSVMLLGAIVGKYKDSLSWRSWMLVALVACILLFYGIEYLWKNSTLQVISSVPLMGGAFFFYLLGDAKLIKYFDNTKVGGNIIFILGSICLECYLIQQYLISDRCNAIFPINIVFIILLVLAVAYIIHVLSEIVRQIMDSNPFDWKKVLLYKR